MHSSYSVDVLFQYKTGGHTYFSTTENFSDGTSSRWWKDWASDFVARFPAGSQTRCWVDPERPWLAVLEKNYRALWLPIVVGAFFAFLGAVGLYASFHNFLNLLRRIIGLPPRNAA